ncbi:MAG: hypothetical protein GY805_14775 [Chloroflexi bacterium]|nr:hypothetical protein [Chloroflexota bacterium]
MSENNQPPCRLFMIMARRAKTAVIFRRGPSKWTQLIQWNTQTDSFEYGHWFKGRIYEKRCDLSPNGNFLLYFVSKFSKDTLADSEYTYAWSAISNPPWLTALVLWPKGNCWHGGGSFKNNRAVMLNHRPNVAIPHPNHRPPKWMTVTSNPNASGEDDPLYSTRLTRDGWKTVKKWRVKHTKSKRGYITPQPEVRLLQHPNQPLNLVLNRHIDGYKYYELYEVENCLTGARIILEQAECARWDQQGRLVFVAEGKLKIGSLTECDTLVTREIADFNDQKPKEVKSPDWATKWK